MIVVSKKIREKRREERRREEKRREESGKEKIRQEKRRKRRKVKRGEEGGIKQKSGKGREEDWILDRMREKYKNL